MNLIARILFAVSLAALLAVFATLLIGPAGAADPAIEAWFKSLKQPGSGMSCCDESDCKRTKARVGPDGWEALTPAGDWISVPEDRIVRPKSNPTGEPILCLSPSRSIYCFVPPAET